MATSSPPAASAPPTSFTPERDGHLHADELQLARARALESVIREHADGAERNRRLAQPVIAAMREAGLFRMFTPRSLGGLELDPVTVARVAEEVATFDPAAAWALQAGNTGAWWAARLPDAGAAEVFGGNPDALIAASFSPPHRAEEVTGGYRFTGRGPLASTIHESPWVFMSGLVFDGAALRMTPAGPVIVGLVMRTSEVEVIDTWHSLGMRGTDSHDVEGKDVFVPVSRSMLVVPVFEPGRHFTGPLYRIPALAATDVIIVPVALAIARGAISELRALADRKTPMGSMKTIRHRSAVQMALAEGEARLRAARLFFYDTLGTMWQRTLAGEDHTLERKADLMLASAYAVRTSAEVTDLMHRMCGTSGVYTRSRLERHLRDAQTIRHHGFLSESRLETVGQVYLGLEPEFGFVAF
jgi:alkylation response protein AidB-like acyl-CoA dehydrogenase